MNVLIGTQRLTFRLPASSETWYDLVSDEAGNTLKLQTLCTDFDKTLNILME